MIRSILAVLDSTTRAPRVLAAATEIAERFEAHLYLFRILDIEHATATPTSSATHVDLSPGRLRKAVLEELSVLAHDNPRARAYPPVLGRGDPAAAIVVAAIQHTVDLIVLGSHELTWLDRLLGTTTASVALRSRCNVLVVHGADLATRKAGTPR